jgi:hypothetical protein
MALIVLLVPVSCTGTQSQAVAEQLVFQPLPWLSLAGSTASVSLYQAWVPGASPDRDSAEFALARVVALAPAGQR